MMVERPGNGRGADSQHTLSLAGSLVERGAATHEI